MAKLVQHEVSEGHVRAIHQLRELASERAGVDASALAASEREEQLAAWLEEHDVVQAWDVAATLADAGLTVDDVSELSGSVPKALVADAIVWVACSLGVQNIASEIASSVGRISELVASVKGYSHMDRSPEHKPTDVREGIDSTLTLLSHKLKKKSIQVVRDYEDDLPLIEAHAGELNQVWTNLVDNAIDAVDDGGEVRIEAHRNNGHLDVSIIDSGHGIPEDIRNRIFEPFFTTKGVGEGTGLGLDIAMRIVQTHRGSMTVDSQPGRTNVLVRLPLAEPSTG